MLIFISTLSLNHIKANADYHEIPKPSPLNYLSDGESYNAQFWHNKVDDNYYIEGEFETINRFKYKHTVIHSTDINHFLDIDINQKISYQGFPFRNAYIISKPSNDRYALKLEALDYDYEIKSLYYGEFESLYFDSKDSDFSVLDIYVKKEANAEVSKVASFEQEKNQKKYQALRMQLIKYDDIISDDPIDVSDLPDTSGSPYNLAGIYGDVIVSKKSNNTYNFIINYDNKNYNLEKTFEDTSFLENITSSYYYTYENMKFIIFNYGTEEILFKNNPSTNFEGFSTWNLSTNEIINTNKIKIYNMLEIDDDNNIFSYFYTPDIVVDNLLQVDINFEYNYYKKSFPDFWNYTKANKDNLAYGIILEQGKSTTVSNIPKWRQDLYKKSALATAVGLLIPGLRFPALLVGSGVLLYNWSQDNFELKKDYDINQIEKISNPSLELIKSVNESYTNMAGRKIEVDLTSNSLHKLHLGQFDNYEKVSIESKKIISSFTYETNGKVITINEDYIEEHTDVPAPLTPPDITSNINYIAPLIICEMISIAIMIILLKNTRKKSFITVFLIFIFFIALGLVFYYIYSNNLLEEFLNKIST